LLLFSTAEVGARKALSTAFRGRGLGEGAVPLRKADREAGKHFFFEKKKQKKVWGWPR
jgi:hypothetical protein